MAPDDTLFGVVRNGVLTLFGFVTSISVYAGQLKIRDDLKGAEVELTLSRAHCPVSRIISLRGEGMFSLAAVRWLSGAGISLVHLDYDGTPLLATFPTPRSPVPAALRRAQAALAAGTRLGASIAQDLIRRKIAGQIEVLREFGRPEHAAASETELRGLAGPREARILDLLGVEGRVSANYWQALADQSLSFGKRQIVPDHWQKFGRRQSPLTGENRGAVTPGNALINYCIP